MWQIVKLTERRFVNEINSKSQPGPRTGARYDHTARDEQQRVEIRGDAVAREHE
jgi:hypothetical protein